MSNFNKHSWTNQEAKKQWWTENSNSSAFESHKSATAQFLVNISSMPIEVIKNFVESFKDILKNTHYSDFINDGGVLDITFNDLSMKLIPKTLEDKKFALAKVLMQIVIHYVWEHIQSLEKFKEELSKEQSELFNNKDQNYFLHSTINAQFQYEMLDIIKLHEKLWNISLNIEKLDEQWKEILPIIKQYSEFLIKVKKWMEDMKNPDKLHKAVQKNMDTYKKLASAISDEIDKVREKDFKPGRPIEINIDMTKF